MSTQTLRIPSQLWSAIREDLLSTPELERAAVGFAGQAGNGSRRDLLLRDWSPVPLDEYDVQLSNHLEVSALFWARAAKRARKSGEALVIMHSHPRDEHTPRFSGSDDFGEDRLIPKIQARADISVGAVVMSPGGEQGRITDASGKRQAMAVHRVGLAQHSGTASHQRERFDRQVRALGQHGQSLLASSTIGVVGAGGLGSHVVQQLIHLGVGRVVVVDPDVVAESNLTRLVGASHLDVVLRRRKTRVSRRLARRVHSGTQIIEVRKSVTHADGAIDLLACNVIIGCTDNHWSRSVLNSMAFQYYVPVLDLGVELQTRTAGGGRAVWLEPGSACLWCLGIIDPERVRIEQLPASLRKEELTRGYIEGLDEPAPAVVSINGVVASLGVTELLARLTGFAGDDPRPQVLLYRLSDGVVRRTAATPKASCPTCSASGALGIGDLGAPPWIPTKLN